MKIMTIDFETYYDKDYSLTKLTTEAYVRDPRFEVLMVGIMIDGGEPRIMAPLEFIAYATTPTSTGRSCRGTTTLNQNFGSIRYPWLVRW